MKDIITLSPGEIDQLEEVPENLLRILRIARRNTKLSSRYEIAKFTLSRLHAEATTIIDFVNEKLS